MNDPVTYQGIPLVFNPPRCPLCKTEMTRCGPDDKFDCPMCRANAEINRLKAIILDRNEAIEVFQSLTEENNDKLNKMYSALTSVGQTLVTISAHVVNCVNRIEDARKKR